ncbi:MAG: hypothetical protein ABJK37_17600 [Paraglaciecola sp.]|uniref:hypothetical protein n=1 Tax=Paraglaciecola sp. TaxID=1920173 RepID=UPI0032991139
MLISQQHYLVGYGSLLSHDSRSRYSNIFCDNMPILAHGWQREWLARGIKDLQTCLGVSRVESAHLNAVLLPIEQISLELRTREQDYEFVEVDPTTIVPAKKSTALENELFKIRSNPDKCKIWICVNLHKKQASTDYPIYQSYLDTCLVGCFDMDIDNFATEFIRNTYFWKHGWVNDRGHWGYPRAAKVTKQQQLKIDLLLEQLQLLKYRREQI